MAPTIDNLPPSVPQAVPGRGGAVGRRCGGGVQGQPRRGSASGSDQLITPAEAFADGVAHHVAGASAGIVFIAAVLVLVALPHITRRWQPTPSTLAEAAEAGPHARTVCTTSFAPPTPKPSGGRVEVDTPARRPRSTSNGVATTAGAGVSRRRPSVWKWQATWWRARLRAAVGLVGTLVPAFQHRVRKRSRTVGRRAMAGRRSARCACDSPDRPDRAPAPQKAGPACMGAAARCRSTLRPDLREASQVHHRHPVGDTAHDGKVVGDEQVRGRFAPANLHQVDDLGLHRDVQRRDRLVGHDHPRIQAMPRAMPTRCRWPPENGWRLMCSG